MKIYLLSHYDEYGSEDVAAYATPDALVADYAEYAVRVFASRYISREQVMVVVNQELPNLLGVIHKAEVHPGTGFNTGDGWGGIQVHVVEVRK